MAALAWVVFEPYVSLNGAFRPSQLSNGDLWCGDPVAHLGFLPFEALTVAGPLAVALALAPPIGKYLFNHAR